MTGYVSKYGEALRRLTALEMAPAMSGQGPALPAGPMPGGPAPGGAFDVAPSIQAQPNAADMASQGAFDAMEMSAPAGATAQAGQFQDGLTAKDLWDQLPDDEKTKLEEQVADSGIDVDAAYEKAAAEDPEAKKRASRREKLGFLAEVALRTISNYGGRPGTRSEADYADARLATMERRGAIERMDAEQAAAAAEKRRLEGRADSKDATKRQQELEDEKRRRGEKVSDDELAHKRALELKRAEAALRKAEEKGKNAAIVQDDSGAYYILDKDSGDAIGVTTKKTVTTRGKRGVKFTEVETVPLVGAKKPAGAAGIDQDTLIRAISDRAKTMAGDTKVMREIRATVGPGGNVEEELYRRARESVMKDYTSVSGGGGSETDPFGIL